MHFVNESEIQLNFRVMFRSSARADKFNEKYCAYIERLLV